MPPKPQAGKGASVEKLPTLSSPPKNAAGKGSEKAGSKPSPITSEKLPKLAVAGTSENQIEISTSAATTSVSESTTAAAAVAVVSTDATALALAAEQEKKEREEADRLQKLKEAEQAAEAEIARKKLMGNGMVTLVYQLYNEQFPIVDGSTTHANIDDVYCLSHVMPNCKIHLSKLTPKEKAASEENNCFDVMIDECPIGTYLDLEKDQTYYVYIEEENDPNQAIRDAERMKKIAEKANAEVIDKGDGRGMEGCSCIYGNPCLDEYGCRDWGNRFAIATANGWKGF